MKMETHPCHPANPIVNGETFNTGYTGLTKREHFAGLALQGLLTTDDGQIPYEKMAAAAVHYADHLIKQLNLINDEK